MRRHIGFAAAALLATLSISACKGRGGRNAYDTGSASGQLPAATSPDSPPGAMPGNAAAPNTTATPANGMMPVDTSRPKTDTAHKKKHSKKHK